MPDLKDSASMGSIGNENGAVYVQRAGRLVAVYRLDYGQGRGSDLVGLVLPRRRFGRVVTMKDYDNRPLIYAYDSAGRATSMTDWHGFTTTYTYTALGQVSTITAPGSKLWDYDYNVLGQPTKVTAPNAMTTEYNYDGANRMTKMAYKDGATTVDSLEYKFTAGGQISKMGYNDNSYWDYGYDARGRLTSAVRKNSGGTTQTSHTYVYDGGDNMVSKTVDGTLTTFAYTVANELTTQTTGGVTTTYGYDDWGQLSWKSQGAYGADYDWRYGHKLSKVASNFPGEGTVQYGYRGDGRLWYRLESPSGALTMYNYDKGWNVVSEEDYGGNLQAAFTYVDPAAKAAGCLGEFAGTNPENGTAKYYFRDHLGSTRRIHAADGSTLATTEYRPYGDTYSTSGTQPRFTFTGKSYDPTAAMYYFPYRHYAPDIGRWIIRDPVGMVRGTNIYSYVGTSPVNRVDPLGLDYVVFDKGASRLTWNYTVTDIGTIYHAGFVIYVPFQRVVGQRVYEAHSGNGSLNLHPLPDGTYHTSPSDREIREPYSGWGDVAYRLHRGLIAYILCWWEERSAGFFIHGGISPGTAGCIELAWGEDQSQMWSFDSHMQEYGEAIDVYVR